MEFRVRKSYADSFLRQKFGGRCLQLKWSQSLRMDLWKVFVFAIFNKFTRVFEDSGRKTAKMNNAFLLHVVFRRKIEDMYVPSIELLIHCWFVLDVIVIVIKQKIVDENFCLFIIFPFLLVDCKTGKSLTYDWLNCMFLFLLCYSNVCYAGVFA